MKIESNLELKTVNQVLFLEIKDRINSALGMNIKDISENRLKSFKLDYETLTSMSKQDMEYESAEFLVKNLISKLEFLLGKE